MYGLVNGAGDEIALAGCDLCDDTGAGESDTEHGAAQYACPCCVRGHLRQAYTEALFRGGDPDNYLDPGVRNYLAESAEPEAA